MKKISESAEFCFDMEDIGRIRNDMLILIRNLSKAYKETKQAEVIKEENNDLNSMTLNQLIEECKKRKINADLRFNKKTLIAKLKSTENNM